MPTCGNRPPRRGPWAAYAGTSAADATAARKRRRFIRRTASRASYRPARALRQPLRGMGSRQHHRLLHFFGAFFALFFFADAFEVFLTAFLAAALPVPPP